MSETLPTTPLDLVKQQKDPKQLLEVLLRKPTKPMDMEQLARGLSYMLENHGEDGINALLAAGRLAISFLEQEAQRRNVPMSKEMMELFIQLRLKHSVTDAATLAVDQYQKSK